MPRKKPEQPETSELVALIRDLVTQQSKVLEVAMETQKAQAEVLQKWIGMFAPPAQPEPSTSMEDRERLREEMEREGWDPVDFDPFKMDLN